MWEIFFSNKLKEVLKLENEIILSSDDAKRLAESVILNRIFNWFAPLFCLIIIIIVTQITFFKKWETVLTFCLTSIFFSFSYVYLKRFGQWFDELQTETQKIDNNGND